MTAEVIVLYEGNYYETRDLIHNIRRSSDLSTYNTEHFMRQLRLWPEDIRYFRGPQVYAHNNDPEEGLWQAILARWERDPTSVLDALRETLLKDGYDLSRAPRKTDPADNVDRFVGVG
jgi:hypothetical protein